MKITVGHILILFGVGGYLYLGPLQNLDRFKMSVDDIRNFAADKLPYLELLRVEKPKQTVLNSVAEKSLLPAANDAVEKPSVEVVSDEQVLTPESAQVATQEKNDVVKADPTPVVAKKIAKKTKKTVKKRKKTVTKAVVRKPAPTPAPQTAVQNSLMDTYVQLTLKNGNVVKGVLIEQTASNYKIDLPGMGGFDYPADTVTKIGPAQ